MSGMEAEYIERAVTSERRGHTESSLVARLTALYAGDSTKAAAGLRVLQGGEVLEITHASFSKAFSDWADLRDIQMALPTGAWGKVPVPVPEVVNG